MKYVQPKVFDITKHRPAVLLVGNGLNRCAGDDTTWDNAILKLAKDDAILDKIKRLDYSIRATVTADENDEKRWSRYVKLFDNDFKYFDNPLLKNLLKVPFDAVLTTNYTYELENALDGNYPCSDHKEDWACTTAANYISGKQPDSVRLLNTFNRLKNEDGRDVDIWHIHGEVRDPASMILTHEEYGRLVTELVREEENEHNEGEILFDSWQDYFVYGDLYILGQGVDFAEFDLWWMLSRRRREKTGHGRTIYFAPKPFSPKHTGSDTEIVARMLPDDLINNETVKALQERIKELTFENQQLKDNNPRIIEALDQIGVKIDNCGVTLPEWGTKSQEELNLIFRDFYKTAMARITDKILHPLPLDTEILIDYREKAAKNGTKTNKLRLMYQLAKTTVLIPGDKDADGCIHPWLYRYQGEDPFMLMIFSTRDAYDGDIEDLHEITGLKALDLAESTSRAEVIILDPFSLYGDVWLPLRQAEYMRKDPEWLKSYVESADERDLARKKNNINKASEEAHSVSAFISNCIFDGSLEEVWSDIENQGCFNYEMMLHQDEVQWTSPHWAKPGDIIFFSHAQKVRSQITKMLSKLKSVKDSISEERYNRTERELKRALENYDKYGRKIFAIGQVVEETEEIASDDPFYEDPSLYHFQSRNFSCITNIFELKHPVSTDDFKDFISINMFGSITNVFGEKFTQLQKLILEKNKDMGDEIPYYFRKSTPAPIAPVDLNEENWLLLDSGYRSKFTLKHKYQKYYTDYVLKSIGDTKKIDIQCRYSKPGQDDAFMDNVILFDKRRLPVKIFVEDIRTDKDLEILENYCHASEIFISNDKPVCPPKIYTDKVLVIDKKQISVYDSLKQKIRPVQQLDELKTVEDLTALKQKLSAALSSSEITDILPEEQTENVSVQNNEKLVEEPEQYNPAGEPEIVEPLSGYENDIIANTYQGTDYVPAEYPITPIGWAEFCLPSKKSEIAERAVLIVEGEKIVQRDKLIEKLRNSFGVKNSEKVSEAVEKALKFAKIKTTKVKGIPYCWATDIDPKTYTGFRYHESIKRRDDELPLPEIRNAVVRTVMDNGPLDEDELLIRTARTFGYQRLGPNLRSRLSEGIAYAVSDKLIRLDKQKKYELR